jgi:hypothetical protein
VRIVATALFRPPFRLVQKLKESGLSHPCVIASTPFGGGLRF